MIFCKRIKQAPQYLDLYLPILARQNELFLLLSDTAPDVHMGFGSGSASSLGGVATKKIAAQIIHFGNKDLRNQIRKAKFELKGQYIFKGGKDHTPSLPLSSLQTSIPTSSPAQNNEIAVADTSAQAVTKL